MSRVKANDKKKRKGHISIHTPLRNKELLVEEYVIKNKTRKQIASEYNLKESFIKDLLWVYDIRKPGSGRFIPKKQKGSDSLICNLYTKDNKTIEEISYITEDSPWKIRQCLLRSGVSIRRGCNKFVKPHHMKGKKASFRTRKKQSMAKLKVTEESWEGFSPRRKRPGAKRWRKEILLRDGYKCKFCSSSVNLEAHHILPVSTHPNKVSLVNNGITLCVVCHKGIRGKELKVSNFCCARLREYESYKYQSYCGTGSLYVNEKFIVDFSV